MKYRIVWDTTLQGLEGAVNLAVSAGWKPIGGVAVCYILPTLNFYQAMTKGEEI